MSENTLSVIKTFGAFTDQILQYANETFTVLHARFLKKIWGNSVTNKLHCNQVAYNWKEGRYEIYIPTRDNAEYNLSYYRIAIQVLPEISNETKRLEAYKLQEQKLKPLGNVESELLILIAPKVKRWVPGGVRGFKHLNKPGYFTAIFVNKSPEIIWKRVMDHLLNFISKRLDGLMNALGFETWVWKWILSKRNNYGSNIRILEHFSFVIRQSFETLVLLYQHFRDKLRLVLGEIGAENVALQVLRPLKALRMDELTRVFTIVRERLAVQIVAKEDEGVRYLEAIRRAVPCEEPNEAKVDWGKQQPIIPVTLSFEGEPNG